MAEAVPTIGRGFLSGAPSGMLSWRPDFPAHRAGKGERFVLHHQGGGLYGTRTQCDADRDRYLQGPL